MILKWIFDKTASLVGLVCLSPVLLIVALLIRRKMPGGPVIFRQKRVGQGGRLFTMCKFRSMTVAGEGKTSVAAAEGARITPLGEKLRRYKLDELPELWNVLKGDMSFVGPRPDVPGYADKLQGADREMLRLKPGITGPASLKYRDEEELLAKVGERLAYSKQITQDGKVITSIEQYNDEVIFPDKVRINRYYLHHYSFAKDIQMIMCTVLGKKMEYGGEMI